MISVVTDRAANRECELESEPMQCHPAVFPLSSPFRCLGSRSGRAMGQNHRRFDFVSSFVPLVPSAALWRKSHWPANSSGSRAAG